MSCAFVAAAVAEKSVPKGFRLNLNYCKNQFERYPASKWSIAYLRTKFNDKNFTCLYIECFYALSYGFY